MLHLSRFWLSGGGNIALFRTVPWLASSPRLGQNTPSTELFSQKNDALLSNFFSSSNILFIRLFLANTWKKNRGLPALFPHKLPWNVVLNSEITLRMENWRGGDWDETQNGAHVIRRKGCVLQNQGNTLIRINLWSHWWAFAKHTQQHPWISCGTTFQLRWSQYYRCPGTRYAFMSRFQHPPQTTGNEANISAGDRPAG